MLRSTGKSWYLFDGHGSTRQLTDNNGNITDTDTYCDRAYLCHNHRARWLNSQCSILAHFLVLDHRYIRSGAWKIVVCTSITEAKDFRDPDSTHTCSKFSNPQVSFLTLQ
jgi:hypothetical protein